HEQGHQNGGPHLYHFSNNYDGYQNLTRLISKAHLEGFYYRPRIDKDLLAQHAAGLIGLTGCLKGEVNGHILGEDVRKAADALDSYRQIFGPEHLYVELMSHGVDGQIQVNRQLLAFSRDFGLPVVATNDCHYLRREDAAPHDVLLCIGTGKTLNDPQRMRYGPQEFYFKTPEEMYQVFTEIPEACANTLRIAQRITDIDPLKYNLLFERFLNPERVTMPDIDIDFCMDRRDEVIRYVTDKYGAENVAQIITFGSMLAKGVLRDVGRVLDLPYNDVDRIAKLVPNRLHIALDEAIAEEPRLRELQTQDPRVERLIDTARRLEGLSRHASVHAAGVVISPEPLHNIVPL